MAAGADAQGEEGGRGPPSVQRAANFGPATGAAPLPTALAAAAGASYMIYKGMSRMGQRMERSSTVLGKQLNHAVGGLGGLVQGGLLRHAWQGEAKRQLGGTTHRLH